LQAFYTEAILISEQNVEILRRAYEAFNSEDIGRILAFAHPDFETAVPPELSAEPDIYRGHDGIRRYFRTFQDAMDEIRFEPERFWDVGESVVAVVGLNAKGRQSGISVEQRLAQVWTFHDGKAIEVRTYASLSEALESVGLADG
jgi:ketosteroid isomerase-like protein